MRLKRGAEEEGGNERCADRENELSGLRLRGERVELQRLALDASSDHRRTGNEQEIADDRSGERSADNVRQTRANRENGDDHLREIPERRVEQRAGRRSHPMRELLGACANPRGKRQDGEASEDE